MSRYDSMTEQEKRDLFEKAEQLVELVPALIGQVTTVMVNTSNALVSQAQQITDVVIQIEKIGTLGFEIPDEWKTD